MKNGMWLCACGYYLMKTYVSAVISVECPAHLNIIVYFPSNWAVETKREYVCA